MPEYVYRAITKEGVIVKNRVESGNKQTLIKRLKEGNLTPIDVVQVGYGRKKVNTKRKNVTDIDEIMRTANSSSVIQGRGRKKQSFVEKVNLAANPGAESDKSQERIIADIFAFPFEGAALAEGAILTERAPLAEGAALAEYLYITVIPRGELFDSVDHLEGIEIRLCVFFHFL